MTLNNIAEIINENVGMSSLIITVIFSLVQVSKIPLNPWSIIGNVMNKDLIKSIKDQDESIKMLYEKADGLERRLIEKETMESRYRILRFDDEVRHDQLHTKEHYDQIIEDIDKYEDFCKNNKWYSNNKAEWAIENIRDAYKKRSRDNSFLK